MQIHAQPPSPALFEEFASDCSRSAACVHRMIFLKNKGGFLCGQESAFCL